MAILDTFYTLFKTNADEAKKGFDNADQSAGKFAKSIASIDDGVHVAGERMVETFVEIGSAIAGAFAFERVKEFLETTIEVNARLQQTSDRMGIAVEDLAALQSAATRFGGSADGVTGSLDFLNRGLADIAVKGTSRLKPFFDELKINVLDSHHRVKSLVEVLGQLSDKMAKKTVQERAGLGERFALDPGLLLAMAQGRRALEDLINRQKELGVTTEEDAEQAEKFERKMADLRTVFHHFGNEIVTGILPFLGKLVDGAMQFVNFLEHHKPLVEGFFISIGGVIAAFYTQAVIRAAIATAVWLAEVLLIPALIAGAIAALAFLYDDIQNFLAGNKSVIGEMTKRWPIVGEVVREVAQDIAAAWKWIVDVISGGAGAVKSVINVTLAIFAKLASVAGDVGRAIGAVFKREFPDVAELIMHVADAISHLVGWLIKAAEWFGKLGLSAVLGIPKALAHASDYLNSAAVSINGPKLAMGGTAPSLAQRDKSERTQIAALYDRREPPTALAAAVAKGRDIHPADTAAAVAKGREQVQTATATPLAAMGRAASLHTQHISKKVSVHIENVNVQTQASDPQAVAGAVGDHLTDHIRKAINQHDDGVAG